MATTNKYSTCNLCHRKPPQVNILLVFSTMVVFSEPFLDLSTKRWLTLCIALAWIGLMRSLEILSRCHFPGTKIETTRSYRGQILVDLGGNVGQNWEQLGVKRSCDHFKTRVFSFSVSSFASTPCKDLDPKQNLVLSPDCVM